MEAGVPEEQAVQRDSSQQVEQPEEQLRQEAVTEE